MKKSKLFILWLLLFLLLSFTVSAYAVLQDNGDGTVTQTRNDGSVLMWLKNTNLAASETFGVSGISSVGWMRQTVADNWIAAMNTANYLGYNDWRLPATLPVNGISYNYEFSYVGASDIGYNVSAPGSAYAGSTGSEMAYMYYIELGNLAAYDTAGNLQPGYGLKNTGPFINIIKDWGYRSSTQFSSYHDVRYCFDVHFGAQSGYEANEGLSSWAVRDVTVAPEPISSVLFVTGGTLLGGRRLLKRRRS